MKRDIFYQLFQASVYAFSFERDLFFVLHISKL